MFLCFMVRKFTFSPVAFVVNQTLEMYEMYLLHNLSTCIYNIKQLGNCQLHSVLYSKATRKIKGRCNEVEDGKKQGPTYVEQQEDLGMETR